MAEFQRHIRQLVYWKDKLIAVGDDGCLYVIEPCADTAVAGVQRIRLEEEKEKYGKATE